MMGRTLIIGLTGSIGMGKSTLTRQFAALGARTCNADEIVHRLLGRDGRAVDAVDKAFPGCRKNGVIDRQALGAIVFKDPGKRKALEAILHPLVAEEETRFVMAESRRGAKLVVLDIPLLFETGAHLRCDLSLVASAPAFIQRQRVMARPGMTADKFRHIVASQMSDREKRLRADIVISTGLGRGYSFRKAAEFIREIT